MEHFINDREERVEKLIENIRFLSDALRNNKELKPWTKRKFRQNKRNAIKELKALGFKYDYNERNVKKNF